MFKAAGRLLFFVLFVWFIKRNSLYYLAPTVSSIRECLSLSNHFRIYFFETSWYNLGKADFQYFYNVTPVTIPCESFRWLLFSDVMNPLLNPVILYNTVWTTGDIFRFGFQNFWNNTFPVLNLPEMFTFNNFDAKYIYLNCSISRDIFLLEIMKLWLDGYYRLTERDLHGFELVSYYATYLVIIRLLFSRGYFLPSFYHYRGRSNLETLTPYGDSKGYFDNLLEVIIFSSDHTRKRIVELLYFTTIPSRMRYVRRSFASALFYRKPLQSPIAPTLGILSRRLGFFYRIGRFGVVKTKHDWPVITINDLQSFVRSCTNKFSYREVRVRRGFETLKVPVRLFFTTYILWFVPHYIAPFSYHIIFLPQHIFTAWDLPKLDISWPIVSNVNYGLIYITSVMALFYPQMIKWRPPYWLWYKRTLYILLHTIIWLLLLAQLYYPEFIITDSPNVGKWMAPEYQIFYSVALLLFLGSTRIILERGTIASTPRPDYNKYVGVKTHNIVYFTIFLNIFSSPLNNPIAPLISFVVLLVYTTIEQWRYFGRGFIRSTAMYARVTALAFLTWPLIYLSLMILKTNNVHYESIDTSATVGICLLENRSTVMYFYVPFYMYFFLAAGQEVSLEAKKDNQTDSIWYRYQDYHFVTSYEYGLYIPVLLVIMVSLNDSLRVQAGAVSFYATYFVLHIVLAKSPTNSSRNLLNYAPMVQTLILLYVYATGHPDIIVYGSLLSYICWFVHQCNLHIYEVTTLDSFYADALPAYPSTLLPTYHPTGQLCIGVSAFILSWLFATTTGMCIVRISTEELYRQYGPTESIGIYILLSIVVMFLFYSYSIIQARVFGCISFITLTVSSLLKTPLRTAASLYIILGFWLVLADEIFIPLLYQSWGMNHFTYSLFWELGLESYITVHKPRILS